MPHPFAAADTSSRQFVARLGQRVFKASHQWIDANLDPPSGAVLFQTRPWCTARHDGRRAGCKGLRNRHTKVLGMGRQDEKFGFTVGAQLCLAIQWSTKLDPLQLQLCGDRLHARQIAQVIRARDAQVPIGETLRYCMPRMQEKIDALYRVNPAEEEKLSSAT